MAGYGMSAAFRHALDARGLIWAVGIPRTQKVYTPKVRLRWPRAGTGRPRQRPEPSAAPRAVEAVLAKATWRRLSWRQGTKGKLAERFAMLRVRVADGPTTRTGRHLPGQEVWLIGEWRASGERKYYLSNLPPTTPKRRLVAGVKARWVCEPAHQQLKQELGLGHFEGRLWTGLHRHALMTCIAFAYLQHVRLATASAQQKGARSHNPRDRRHSPACPPSAVPSLHGSTLISSRHLFARAASIGSDHSLAPELPR